MYPWHFFRILFSCALNVAARTDPVDFKTIDFLKR